MILLEPYTSAAGRHLRNKSVSGTTDLIHSTSHRHKPTKPPADGEGVVGAIRSATRAIPAPQRRSQQPATLCSATSSSLRPLGFAEGLTSKVTRRPADDETVTKVIVDPPLEPPFFSDVNPQFHVVCEFPPLYDGLVVFISFRKPSTFHNIC